MTRPKMKEIGDVGFEDFRVLSNYCYQLEVTAKRCAELREEWRKLLTSEEPVTPIVGARQVQSIRNQIYWARKAYNDVERGYREYREVLHKKYSRNPVPFVGAMVGGDVASDDDVVVGAQHLN